MANAPPRRTLFFLACTAMQAGASAPRGGGLGNISALIDGHHYVGGNHDFGSFDSLDAQHAHHGDGPHHGKGGGPIAHAFHWALRHEAQLAPGGGLLTPELSQGVRRAVRKIGRSMGVLSIKSRRATKGGAEAYGEVKDYMNEGNSEKQGCCKCEYKKNGKIKRTEFEPAQIYCHSTACTPYWNAFCKDMLFDWVMGQYDELCAPVFNKESQIDESKWNDKISQKKLTEISNEFGMALKDDYHWKYLNKGNHKNRQDYNKLPLDDQLECFALLDGVQTHLTDLSKTGALDLKEEGTFDRLCKTRAETDRCGTETVCKKYKVQQAEEKRLAEEKHKADLEKRNAEDAKRKAVQDAAAKKLEEAAAKNRKALIDKISKAINDETANGKASKLIEVLTLKSEADSLFTSKVPDDIRRLEKYIGDQKSAFQARTLQDKCQQIAEMKNTPQFAQAKKETADLIWLPLYTFRRELREAVAKDRFGDFISKHMEEDIKEIEKRAKSVCNTAVDRWKNIIEVEMPDTVKMARSLLTTSAAVSEAAEQAKGGSWESTGLLPTCLKGATQACLLKWDGIKLLGKQPKQDVTDKDEVTGRTFHTGCTLYTEKMAPWYILPESCASLDQRPEKDKPKDEVTECPSVRNEHGNTNTYNPTDCFSFTGAVGKDVTISGEKSKKGQATVLKVKKKYKKMDETTGEEIDATQEEIFVALKKD